MAAPAYTWKFVKDLWGNRIPKKATLEAASGLETKVGTLVNMSTGQVAAAGATHASLIGLALNATTAAATAGDAVEVELIGEGMVIRGTADADATALAGFSGKTVDTNADGSLDVADVTNGALSVYRVNNAAGTEVDCVVTIFDMGA